MQPFQLRFPSWTINQKTSKQRERERENRAAKVNNSILFCFLVSRGLLIFWFHISGDQEAGYQNDAAAVAYDYNYENQDYVEEPQPSLIPQFTTQAEHFKVAKDRILRLPCRVDQLGKPKFWPLFCDTKAQKHELLLVS